MYQQSTKINNKTDLNQKVAWLLLIVSLLALLGYGISFFLTAPKIETITTNPSNTNTYSNSYLNQTQDADFKNQPAKKHSK